MRDLTRRSFLKTAGNAGLALGAADLLAGCTTLRTPPEITPSPVDTPVSVAVIRGDNLADMARQALAAFGGASAIVQPGETVFIKPNFATLGLVRYDPIPRGEVVKPEIVIAVAEECLKAGAARVTIGEAGQVPSWDWAHVQFLDGSTNMAAAVQQLNDAYGDRVRLVCLNAETPAWIPVPSQSRLSSLDVSSLVIEADRVISLPVIKAHRWAMMTGALKNFLGVTPISHYSSPLLANMRGGLHDAGIHQVIVDISKGVGVDFAITDFSIGGEGNGPFVMPGWWGSSVDMRDRLGTWMLLASTDPVALDATSTRVISLDPQDVTHVRLAWEQGIGQMLQEKITLLGATLDEIRMDWQAPQITVGLGEVVIPAIHLLTDG